MSSLAVALGLICYLPQSITGKGLTYTYDAIGQKLRKQSGTTITEYISSIQYSGNTTGTTIGFVQAEEGGQLTAAVTILMNTALATIWVIPV